MTDDVTVWWRSWYPREKSLGGRLFWAPRTCYFCYCTHFPSAFLREALWDATRYHNIWICGSVWNKNVSFFLAKRAEIRFFSFPIQAYGRVQLKNQFYHRISENLVLIFCKVTQSKGRKIMGLKMFSRKKLYCETENSYILYCALCGG